MSGIVDMWSNEAGKLKEKNNAQSILSTKMEGSTSTGKLAIEGVNEFIEKLKTVMVKLPAFECSEASLSMIVDTFSA